MRRLLPLMLLCALAAGCGGGGTSAADTFAQQQTAACAKVQKRLAAIKRPPAVPQSSAAARRRESAALQRYAIAIDRALLAGVADLRAVQAPQELAAAQKRWLEAVRVALRARLRLDKAPARQLKQASRAELRTRRAANSLAGKLGIANGCTLTY
jgi:hypothetical protein